MITVFLCIALIVTLLVGEHALAAPVISEVHWAGSDLSTADEWVEVTDSGAGSEGSTMSGWTLTSVNSSGVETVIFRFPAAARASVHDFLVVSHFAAGQSRLLSEPAYVASSVSLPNTKLLLRLRDASGQVIDQADDGVGEPMAGENLGSPVRKSSMERVDLLKPGTDASNWVTASEMVGWKDGQMVMRGTPGFSRQNATSSASSLSSLSSFSSISFSSASSASSPALSEGEGASSASAASSFSSSASSASCASIDPYFIIQSGNTSGMDKVTINIQIGTHAGSLTGASCTVDFDDGITSSSCNPPSHTFDEPGSFSITADVKHACGVTAVPALSVHVAGGSSSASSRASAPTVQTSMTDVSFAGRSQSAGGQFLLTAVLPNPQGKDDGREWIEITNVSGMPASLEGWTLRLPHAKKGKYVFGVVGFGVQEAKRFLGSELGMTFPNAAGEFLLIDPSGRTVSQLTWKDARDGVIIRPSQTFSGEIPVRVVHVVDGDTLDVELLTSALSGFGRTERVRLIGIDAPEMHASDPRQRMLAKRAVEFLRDLLEGAAITLLPGTEARDGYGRLLAYAQTQDGDSIQEMLLREGLASVYLRYAFAKEGEFIAYQREAQEGNGGMWGIIETEAESGKWKVVRSQSTEPLVAETSRESVASSRTTEIFHLEKALSSASKSSKKKSSSSTARRRAVTVKKAPVRVAVILTSSSLSSTASAVAMNDEPNMTPLFPPIDDHQSALTADLLALRELIETPELASSSAAPVDDVLAVQPSVERGTFPLILLGLAMSGMASLSGIVGWTIARRTQDSRCYHKL